MTLDEARENVGKPVVYRPYPDARTETGVIHRVGTALVFVRYGNYTTPQGTLPEHLELA